MGDTDQSKDQSKNDSCDESEDESEVLEESPCGRWQKRREEVDQRDVPGIDNAFLAMDTEEGVEVVWNEVQFSEKRNFRAQQDQIRQVFDNLIQLDHPNIVKFHKYWTDSKGEKPRVIFITEYMSSGSLKQFLKKTKMNNKTFPLKVWKRWCTQILSALSYLHSCDPPIIHGNLTCDTVLIQHNGLIKIGSVAPDAIHLHVKTYTEDLTNMHCIAPEYAGKGPVGPAVDIYSFGISALEIAAMGIQTGNGGNHITEEAIKSTLDSLENELQRDFISRCIQKDPAKRNPARELLFHSILFEVHSLKLLAAHTFTKSDSTLPENCREEAYQSKTDPGRILADIKFKDGKDPVNFKVSLVPTLELEKFLEDVRNGIYPLTAFALPEPPPSRPRAVTPELAESIKSETPEPVDVENRIIKTMSCQVKNLEGAHVQLTLLLKMDEKMNRQLQCEVHPSENSMSLAEELVHNGFINEIDKEKIAHLINDNLRPLIVTENDNSVAVGVS